MSSTRMDECPKITILNHLPIVILLEIFIKLPIYDVARCKIVCKLWRKLISKSSFSNNYTRNSPYTSLLLVERTRKEERAPFDLSLLQFSSNGNYIRTPLDTGSEYNNSYNLARGDVHEIRMIGTSNGLICVIQTKYNFFDGNELDLSLRIFISNPITREFITLPPPHYRWYASSAFCEFGFSPSTNEFKVMRIVFSRILAGIGRYIRDEGFMFKNGVEIDIFTVGVDKKWRILKIPKSVPLCHRSFSGGITFNGAFHWIVGDQIHTFDIGPEKEGRIIYPPHDIQISNNRFYILNNNLCLVDRLSDRSQITIWMMKEYGVVESWTKKVILQCWFPHTLSFERLSLVALLRNEGIVLYSIRLFENCVVFYNPMEDKECAQFRISDAEKGFGSKYIFAYTPNFSTLEEIIKIRGERRLLNDALRG